MKSDVHLRRELYNNVVCQVASPCSEVLLNERMTEIADSVDSIHDEDQPSAPIRYGLDDLATWS